MTKTKIKGPANTRAEAPPIVQLIVVLLFWNFSGVEVVDGVEAIEGVASRSPKPKEPVVSLQKHDDSNSDMITKLSK